MTTIDKARLVLGVLAAIAFTIAAGYMIGLTSQSGDSVAEFFDHAVGVASIGAAFLSLGISLPRGAVRTTPPAVLVPPPG